MSFAWICIVIFNHSITERTVFCKNKLVFISFEGIFWSYTNLRNTKYPVQGDSLSLGHLELVLTSFWTCGFSCFAPSAQLGKDLQYYLEKFKVTIMELPKSIQQVYHDHYEWSSLDMTFLGKHHLIVLIVCNRLNLNTGLCTCLLWKGLHQKAGCPCDSCSNHALNKLPFENDLKQQR